LDPFSPQEAVAALAVLATPSPTAEPYFDKAKDRISTFYEQDPPKAAVLAWRPGDAALPRQILAEVIKPTGSFIGVVDVTLKKVVSWRQINVVQEGGNSVDEDEWAVAGAIVLADPTFLAGLTRRGLKPTDISCLPLSWGGQWNSSMAKQEAAGVRLIHVVAIIVANTTNPWFRPVPYLSAVIDSTNKKVLRVDDRPSPPPNPDANNYDDATLAKLKPFPTLNAFAPLTQARGPSYTVNGNEITWQSWKFHVKPHPRAGVVLSELRFLDPRSKQYRSVAYQLHPSELFVPYQNADLDYANRAYMDAGEYGFGLLGSTMALASDCPAQSAFFNLTVVYGSAGAPLLIDKAVCVFERPSAVPAWRHTEFFAGGWGNARSQIELVIRTVTTVGNYDYIIDTVLKTDGTISPVITATGIIEIQPTTSVTVDPADRFAKDPWGTLVSPYHVGSFHDHFFCFRIDLDVDGPNPNRFVRQNLVKIRLPSDNPVGRKSVWHIEENLVKSELSARLIPSLQTPDVWSFRHATTTSNVGNPVAYKLVPGTSAVSLMDDDDPPQKRARFAKYSMWVTPQNDRELWAGGQNVYNSAGEYDGIGNWTAADRNLVDQDLVAWYVIGIHHVTRQEDGPVMPSLSMGFDLMPENFFQDNPALVLAPDANNHTKSTRQVVEL